MRQFLILTALFIAVFLTFTAGAQEPSPPLPPSIEPPPSMLPASPSPASPPYQLQVKGTATQGKALFVTVAGTSKDHRGECSWRGKKYALIFQGKGLSALIPVALDCPAGGYTLKITVTAPGSGTPATLTRVIRTSAQTYGVQYLRLPESQLSKYEDPQAEKDNAEIHRALSYNTPGITWERSFIVPTRGYVSTLFGLKRFYNDDKEPEFHRGQDIAASWGEPVKASQKGIVRFAKKNLVLHGTAVVIDHGKGIGTLYIHMASMKVRAGDSVEQGQVIGTVGATGVATGPHLHFAAYAHDEPISPALLYKLPADFLGR
ncbi:MAG: M23 family metallopeptidase [Candidatus Eremiobacteraeota bacterium]|nr:M23 family metallopeptidase [Candidatus Eremiobacteraeota bacterium]